MSAAEILNKAADLIEERGWTQGEYADGDCLCAVGAISTAATGNPNPWQADDVTAINEALRVLCNHIATDAGLMVSMWNDDQDREQDEVVAALRAAAERVA